MTAVSCRSEPNRQLTARPPTGLPLKAAIDFTPTGVGSVRFAGIDGGAFAEDRQDVRDLLDAHPERRDMPEEFTLHYCGYSCDRTTRERRAVRPPGDHAW